MLIRPFKEYKILAVNSVPDFIDVLKTIFYGYKRRGFDFTLDCEQNPDVAIDILIKNQDKYDLVLVDYDLCPDYNATYFIKTLRQNNCNPHIVLLVGRAQNMSVELMDTMNIQNYCDKITLMQNSGEDLLVLILSSLKLIDVLNTTKVSRDRFKSLLDFSKDIYGFKTLDTLLGNILQHLLQIACTDNVFIIMQSISTDNSEDGKVIFRGNGKFKHYNISETIGEIPAINLPGVLDSIRRHFEISAFLDCSISVPILDVKTKELIGYMYIETDTADLNKGDDFNSVRCLLDLYANQAALAINNSILYSQYAHQRDEATTQYEKLKRHYRNTINALRNAIDAKNAYTKGHSDRVAQYAVGIGKLCFGYNSDKLDKLQSSGFFHDIGKMAISDEILNKPASLTKLEYDKIKQHPEKGYAILGSVTMFEDILHIIKNHHERLDGSGYPRGAREEELDDMTRIISVADSYDAMTSGRKYKSRMTPVQAVNDLLKKSQKELKNVSLADQRGLIAEGYLYDRKIVDAFIEYLITCEKPHLYRDENEVLCDLPHLPEFVLEIEREVKEQERLERLGKMIEKSNKSV